MANDGAKRLFGEIAARIGLDRLFPTLGIGSGARFYNCGRQSARSWWERTDVAASLLVNVIAAAPARPRLFDIGCGDEKFGAELAGRGLAVDYVGFDLHPQTPQVRALDLARETIDDHADIAVVLGVFEYLDDPVGVMRKIAAVAPVLVVSHSASDLGRPADFDPASLNWRLYVDRPTFEAHLKDAGWTVAERRITPDNKTAVWLCRRAA